MCKQPSCVHNPAPAPAPLQVYKRLEEIVNNCSYMEWKHFDAGEPLPGVLLALPPSCGGPAKRCVRQASVLSLLLPCT